MLSEAKHPYRRRHSAEGRDSSLRSE